MEENIDDTFEIRDGGINVENIERQIKENIIERKKLGAYSKDIEDIVRQPILPPVDISYRNDYVSDINYINSNWDIQAEYKISSHRPIIGRLLIWGRKLVNNEVKRYIDLMVEKQLEFNKRIASVLNNINNKISEIDSKIENNIHEDNKINKIDKNINVIERNETMNYFLFEERHRGSFEDIKNRQSIYIQYFKNCQNVLDIGCGRGEFLILLKDNHINGKGVDIDEDMVIYCKRNNLNVDKIDAISYLRLLKNKSLDGIFSSQVAEHIQLDELIDLIKLCYDKMQYGTYIVIETINPLCLTAHINFYNDMSHVRLIHPETLKFLLESVGYRDIEIKFLNLYSDEHRLDKYTVDEQNKKDKNIEIMNKNIDKLNSLLFGYQDYAIIAKK